ncbi:hypothetical protein D3C72_1466920 [compost metagenome]
MLIRKALFPADGVVERPVKTFGLLAVCTAIGRIRTRQLGRHKITVVEILQARRGIKGIGNVKGQLDFRIKNRIEDRITFVKLQVFLLKIIIITPLTELLTEWIL